MNTMTDFDACFRFLYVFLLWFLIFKAALLAVIKLLIDLFSSTKIESFLRFNTSQSKSLQKISWFYFRSLTFFLDLKKKSHKHTDNQTRIILLQCKKFTYL